MYSQEDMEKFLVNRFFLKYKGLIKIDEVRRDLQKYKDKLNFVESVAKEHKIEFDNNVIITGNALMAHELFLVGFSTLDRYCTYRLMGVKDIMDIWLEYPHEDEEIKSNADLKEDTLCLLLNYGESFNKAADDVLYETIMSRVLGPMSGYGKTPKLNWVYSYGLRESAELRYKNLMDLSKMGFKYYDLNSKADLLKEFNQRFNPNNFKSSISVSGLNTAIGVNSNPTGPMSVGGSESTGGKINKKSRGPNSRNSDFDL